MFFCGKLNDMQHKTCQPLIFKVFLYRALLYLSLFLPQIHSYLYVVGSALVASPKPLNLLPTSKPLREKLLVNLGKHLLDFCCINTLYGRFVASYFFNNFLKMVYRHFQISSKKHDVCNSTLAYE